jgi:hypothetical protein
LKLQRDQISASARPQTKKSGLNLFLAKQCLNPTVKAFTQEIRQGLLDAVDMAKRKRLERVILSGAGPAFAGFALPMTRRMSTQMVGRLRLVIRLACLGRGWR